MVEVGAGLGSLTLALAATGARVRAIEFDRALLPALHEVTAGVANVDVVAADATRIDWASELQDGPWILCANLPYNVAVPVLMSVLEEAPTVERLVVLVQREVGERLVAGPGDEHYGPVSVRVAYRATGELTRRVPPSVFWPRPKVASVVVRLERLGGRRRSTSTPNGCGGSSTPGSPSDARRCGARWSGWAWTPGARTTSSRRRASTRAPAPSSSPCGSSR